MSPSPSVGIVGLGVMGGSLARSLAARGVTVRGYSPDPVELQAAREAGAVSVACGSVTETAVGVDWWIVATPLSALARVLAEGAPAAPPRVMDLASLQSPALAEATRAGLEGCHVSAHPMTGSERSGFAASSEGLYDDARIWLSSGPGLGDGLETEAVAFWNELGADPAWIEADAHDARMAAASHLPQLAANALARVLEREGLGPGDLGPGGRDMTRLAASSPELWRDLLNVGAPRAAMVLRRLATELDGLADRLEARDLDAVESLLRETRAWRRT